MPLLRNSICLQTALLVVFGPFVGAAQTPPPPATPAPQDAQTPAATPPAAPAAAPASVWSVGGIDFSGLVDGYYNVNFNHPANRFNQLYNFDVKANQFSLNMVKLTMEHTPDPVGFRVDFGYGRAFDIIHSTEQAPEIFRYLEQAYVSLKPAKAKGFQVDFGEFVTSAGAEVIETKDNWNYSRSLNFAYAIPYYHFGLRTTMPIGKYFTGGVQVVNGWNNVEDNNTGKTLGFTGNFVFKKFGWANTYYTGPEKNNTNKGFRNLYDTVVTLTPNDKLSAYINFDYGRDKRVTSGSDSWVGLSGAVKLQATPWFALSPRIEFFKDKTGFNTGTTQNVKEFTMTGELKMAQGFLTRLEYRRDWSDKAFFDRGNALAASKSLDTVTLGVVAYFGPKH